MGSVNPEIRCRQSCGGEPQGLPAAMHLWFCFLPPAAHHASGLFEFRFVPFISCIPRLAQKHPAAKKAVHPSLPAALAK